MSHLVSTLFWILLIILGAGILGWLLRRWYREGFRCGAGGPGSHGSDGSGGHGDKPGPLSYALEAEVDAHGTPIPRAQLDDGRYAALLAERDALAHERETLMLDLDSLKLKAQEGETLRARFLGEGGGVSAEGGYDLNFDGSAELAAARARIAELEARGSAGAPALGFAAAAAPREVVRYVWGEGEAAQGREGLEAPQALAALQSELDEARARLARFEISGDVGAEPELVLRADLEEARLRIAELEAEASGLGDLRLRAEEAEQGAKSAYAELEDLRAELTTAQSGAEDLKSAADSEAWALRQDLEEARARILELETPAEGHEAHFLTAAESASLERGEEGVFAELATARARIHELEARWTAETPAPREVVRYVWAEGEEGEAPQSEAAAPAAFAALRAELEEARGRLTRISSGEDEGAEPLGFAAAAAEPEADRLRLDLSAAHDRIAELEAKAAEEAEGWRVKFADLETGASAKAEADLGDLRVELTDARNRLADAEAALNAAKAQDVSLEGDLGAAQARIAELEAKAAEEAEGWRVKFADLETGASAKAETEAADLRASFDLDLSAAQARIAELEAKAAEEAEGWRVKFADLETGASAKAEADLGDLRVELTDARNRLADAEAALNAAKAQDVSLEGDLGAAQARIAELEAKAAEEAEGWRVKFADLETGVSAKAETEAADLRASFDLDLSAARARIAELEAKAAEEAEGWRVKFADLETGASAQAEEELGALRNRFAEVEAEAVAARARIHELEARPFAAAAAPDETEALRLRIARLEAGASSSSSEIELLQDRLRKAQAQAAELEANAARFQSGGSGGGLGLAALGAESGQSAAELEALRRDLSEARLRIGELEGSEGRVEIREVIRYVERAPAQDDDQPLTEEEREAEALIRSGGRDLARPEILLAAPRSGEAPDDLKLIRGIGPKLEGLLNDNGIYYFEQLAAFTSRDIAWIDGQLEEFPGRILRDRWVPQAREFARLKREGRPLKGGQVFAEVGGAPAAAAAAAPKTVSAELTKVEAEALRLIDSGESFEGILRLSTALPAPNRGAPDDLKRIRGVAYKLEEQLHDLGIYYFDQIAEMSPQEAAWLDHKLSLRGRVIRYRWIAQSQVFAAESEG